MTETQRLSCLIQALHDAWAQHKGNAHEDGCGWCIFETALHERMMATEAAASVLAPPAPLPWKKATHRCKVCGTLWAYFPAGTTGVMAEAFWSLASDPARMGKCCDNAPMGDQIEALPKEPA